jgi:hypothetical protein
MSLVSFIQPNDLKHIASEAPHYSVLLPPVVCFRCAEMEFILFISFCLSFLSRKFNGKGKKDICVYAVFTVKTIHVYMYRSCKIKQARKSSCSSSPLCFMQIRVGRSVKTQLSE